MISRKNYCKCIINECMLEYGVTCPQDLIPHIAESSTMGIALQQLGYINENDTPAANTYINSRGGIMKTFTEKSLDPKDLNGVHIEILTLREFLNLLPEEVEGE